MTAVGRFALVASLLCLLHAVAAPAASMPPRAMLRVDDVQGTVEHWRADQRQRLTPGMSLQTDDIVHVDDRGGASLQLGRHGRLELGAGSELMVERIPFAGYADDLRTVLRLRSGYLRVVWKQPSLDIQWPLFVYLGDDRANLLSGEYFFQVAAGISAVCVAEGGAALAGGSRDGDQALEPGRCYALVAGLSPSGRERDPSDWVAVRQSRQLTPALWSRDPSASSSWTLSGALLPDREQADQAWRRLKDAGYVGVIAPADVDGRTWYRIELPNLGSRDEADAMAARLKAAGFEQIWVLQR